MGDQLTFIYIHSGVILCSFKSNRGLSLKLTNKQESLFELNIVLPHSLSFIACSAALQSFF